MSAVISVPGSSLHDVIRGLEEARSARLSRVSRLLHDDVGPLLCALGLQVELLLGDRAGELQSHLEQAIEKIRSLSYFAHENLAGRFGLDRALEHLGDFADPRYRGTIQVNRQGIPAAPPERAQALFEIAADALWLMSRGPGASNIEATLTAQGIILESNGSLDSSAFLTYRAACSALSVEIDAHSSFTRISIRS